MLTLEDSAGKAFKCNLPFPIAVNNYYFTEIKSSTFYGQM